MSQGQLADGIVVASGMSHIEAGRFIPSEQILAQFADRLGVGRMPFCALWAPWRRRTQVRKLLKQAARNEDSAGILQLVTSAVQILTPFESYVHLAFADALTQDVIGAYGRLHQAWFEEGVPDVVSNWPGTASERRDVLRLEATVQAAICHMEDRHLAESHWQDVASQRLALCLKPED